MKRVGAVRAMLAVLGTLAAVLICPLPPGAAAAPPAGHDRRLPPIKNAFHTGGPPTADDPILTFWFRGNTAGQPVQVVPNPAKVSRTNFHYDWTRRLWSQDAFTPVQSSSVLNSAHYMTSVDDFATQIGVFIWYRNSAGESASTLVYLYALGIEFPVVTGRPRVGHRLHAEVPPVPAGYEVYYRWYRRVDIGGNEVPVHLGPNYRLTRADKGHPIAVIAYYRGPNIPHWMYRISGAIKVR